jgi:hypothetical protein
VASIISAITKPYKGKIKLLKMDTSTTERFLISTTLGMVLLSYFSKLPKWGIERMGTSQEMMSCASG